MVSMQTTELIITLMTFFLAYAVAVTLAGAFRAWVAEKMGDDTAASLGFTSLNPLVHIDMLGLVFLFLFFFGWGRYVPINHLQIEEPHRRLKMLVAYFADTVTYFFAAFIGITVLIITGGPRMLFIAQQMLSYRQNMSHFFLVTSCPSLSSLTLTLSFIVIAFVYLNVVLGVLTLILNSVSVGMFLIMDRSSTYQEVNYYLIILVPIILIILFSEPLRILAIQLIAAAGFGISRAVGLA